MHQISDLENGNRDKGKGHANALTLSLCAVTKHASVAPSQTLKKLGSWSQTTGHHHCTVHLVLTSRQHGLAKGRSLLLVCLPERQQTPCVHSFLHSLKSPHPVTQDCHCGSPSSVSHSTLYPHCKSKVETQSDPIILDKMKRKPELASHLKKPFWVHHHRLRLQRHPQAQKTLLLR